VKVGKLQDGFIAGAYNVLFSRLLKQSKNCLSLLCNPSNIFILKKTNCMNLLLTTSAGLIYFAGIIFSYNPPASKATITKDVITSIKTSQQKIQAAILLDVSNSMDGLIDQAKAQLWNMVSIMGKAKCNEQAPVIEIALYEYGRENNSKKDGYIKQISAFTGDLDKLSQNLFSLKTNGGDEYCGHVIHTSLGELNWSESPADYKVIFIAGNEDFLQGDVSFTMACTKAKEKGVIVNTIYCGSRQQGILEHWNLGGECGNGSYTNINSNAKEEEIDTPYDSLLFSLNDKLNGTYVAYGRNASSGYHNQTAADVANTTFRKSAGLKRIAVKGKKELYYNGDWDLVDAYQRDSVVLNKVAITALPDSLQKKSKEEIKQIVMLKNGERNTIQKEIAALSFKRDVFIIAEKAKKNTTSTEQTLETEIEKIIKEQAKRFNMQII
jgi:hypothetical protein